MRVPLTIEINGRVIRDEVDPRMLLVEFVREHVRLTGTHVGCDTSYCGACTLLVDGRAVKSCTLLAAQADGRKVTTVEGLERAEELHPLQSAFARNHALQCGFCTPGFLMSALQLLSENPDPDDAAIHDLPNAPPEIEGLLGLNVLGHFTVTLDGVRNQLLLGRH